MVFQSYYSLISNYDEIFHTALKKAYFNPIIVLFLTAVKMIGYSDHGDFNPIIVLFLTPTFAHW